MKFSTVLALTFCVALVSAAPHWNHEKNINKELNSNHEDSSHHKNEEINQNIGDVGSSSSGGLLGLDILSGGILSENKNINNVGQKANIN